MPTLTTVYGSMSASPVGFSPLLLATITFSDGSLLYLSTRPLSTAEGGTDYGIQYNGHDYLGRLDPQDLARVQALSPQGITLIPSVTLTIADPDGYIYLNYEMTAGRGFKGATLTLDLVLYDPLARSFSSDAVRKYYGICEQPKRTRTALSVVSTSLKNPQRQFLPSIHIQPRCPWDFPTNIAQQQDGADNMASPFWNCGYSAQATGANARGNGAFTSCNKTRANCVERGMFNTDSASRVTRRFGGMEWNGPTSYKGKSFIDAKTVIGYNTSNEARFNDLIPLVYGSGWVNLQMLQPLGDPNSTRVEGILCYGEVGSAGVLKVVVNDVELPHENTADKLFTWRYVNRTGSPGNRTGGFNTDALYDGNGDPYGSISVLEVVFPTALGGSGGVPSGKAWINGPKIPVPNSYDTSNSGVASWPLVATTCPVWILLDLLTWCGYQYTEIDIQSWQNAATVCNTNVTYTDQNGNAAAQHFRFHGSLILQASRSASDIIQGVLNSFNGILVPNNDGSLLQLFVRLTLADQQPAPVTGSNYNTGIGSVTALGAGSTGYVAFDFNESNIKFSTLESVPQTSTESGNQISITFQDEDNVFVQDSVSTVDPYALICSGNQELPSQRPIDCISNFDQATRITNVIFAESFRGNPRGDAKGTIRYQFETGSACLHLRIGHIVRFSNQQDSVSNQLFRVEDIQYLPDAESMRIVIAWHSDGWYEDSYGQANDPFYSDPRLNLPLRPCYPWKPAGAVAANADLYPVDPSSGALYSSFALSAGYIEQADGTSQTNLTISGRAPVNTFGLAYPPNVPRQGTTTNTGGAIPPGDYLVGFCSIDAAGGWSPLSKLVPVTVPGGTNTNTISVGPVYWPSNAVAAAVFMGSSEWDLGTNALLGSLGSSFTFTAITTPLVGPPDIKFDHLHVRVKNIAHSGIIGSAISAVASHSITIPGYGAGTDSFTGYVVSLLGFGSPVTSRNLPILDSLITGSTIDGSGNLVLTLHQDFSGNASVRDIVVIRALPDNITATTIGCAKFINHFSPTGINTSGGGETGLVIRIIAGTGEGQERTILSNTSTVYTLTTPWDTLPDATSIFVVADPNWTTLAPGSSMQVMNALPAAPAFVSDQFIGNELGAVYLVQVLTEDIAGSSGPDSYAPVREIYVPGSAGAIAGSVDMVGNPTIVSASYTYSAADAQGVVSVLLRVIYTPPVDANFVGVHGYVEAPDISSTPQSKLDTGALDTASLSPAEPRIDEGQIPYHAADLDADGNITVTLPGIPSPTVVENWRVYLAPYADGFEPAFVAANLSSPTPSIVVAVNPPGTTGTGTEYAPLVLALTLGQVETRYFQSHWEWRATVTWTDPADLSSFGGVDIVLVNITTGDKAYGLQAERDRVAAGQGSLTFNWLPLPDKVETFQVEALSVDRNGNSNSFNLSVTPGLTITTPALPGVGNVTGFTIAQMYGINPFDGSPALILDPTFDPPVDGNGDTDAQFAYCEFRVHIIDTGAWVVLGDPGRSHDSAYVDQQFYPDAAQTWDLYLVSVDSNGKLKYGQSDITDVGDSPTIRITVQPPIGISGAEYAFPILGETVTIVYKIGADGVEMYSFSGTVTPPVDDRYQGVRIVAVPAGEAGIIITELGPNDTSFQTDFWPVSSTTGVTFAVYFLSFDSSGHYNTFVPGFTPEISGIVVTAQTPGKLNAARLDSAKLSTALGISGGKLDILQVDLGKAISTSVGTALAVTSGVLHVPPSAITAALIAAASVGNSKIDRTTIDKLLVVDADIVNLSAAKINAGTLSSGVIYAGTITANNVTAGALTGVTLLLTKNGISTTIDTSYNSGLGGGSYQGFSLVNNSTSEAAYIGPNDVKLIGVLAAGGYGTCVSLHAASSAHSPDISLVTVDGRIITTQIVINGSITMPSPVITSSLYYGSASAGTYTLPSGVQGFLLITYPNPGGGAALTGKIPVYGP